MSTSVRTLIGTMLLPLLAFGGVLLLVAARAAGGATPLVALLGIAGLALYLVATIVGVVLAGGETTQRRGVGSNGSMGGIGG